MLEVVERFGESAGDKSKPGVDIGALDDAEERREEDEGDEEIELPPGLDEREQAREVLEEVVCLCFHREHVALPGDVRDGAHQGRCLRHGGYLAGEAHEDESNDRDTQSEVEQDTTSLSVTSLFKSTRSSVLEASGVVC